MKNMYVVLGILLVLALGILPASATNLLNNPGFENGGGLSSTNWNIYSSANRENWAARQFSYGLALQGWLGPTSGGFYQDVPTTTTGEYTFSIWILQGAGFNPSSLELKLEWLNSASVAVQTATVSNYYDLPEDGLWHHIYVSGVATSASLGVIRSTLHAVMAAANPGESASFIDDAELYTGSYTGTYKLINGGFERSQGETWRGSTWASVPENTGGPRAWANRSGTNGVALFGWDDNGLDQQIQFSEPVYSGTGTYTFIAWMSREQNFLLSNMQMRIEWYDQTYTNKVQADTVTNFTFANDNTFREFHVTGTCTSQNLFEIRPIIQADWKNNPTNTLSEAARIDDIRLDRGAYGAARLDMDWAYHNDPDYDQRFENVPGTNVGPFVQVSYGATSVTFYVMGRDPSHALYYPEEDGKYELRTSWQNPTNGAWVTTWSPMSNVGTMVLSSADPFHGMPTSGTRQVNLWKLVWPMPAADGVTFTNSIRVWYAPFFKATNDQGLETDFNYLLRVNGEATNNLGQTYGKDPYNRDYFVELRPVVYTNLLNPGFETPFSNDWVNAFWKAAGDSGRDDWAARSAGDGGRLNGWSAGIADIAQDVADSGGTKTFAMWIRAETGWNPNLFQLKLSWITADGRVQQSSIKDLSGLPKDLGWHHAYVSGTCTSTDVAIVHAELLSVWGAESVSPGTLMFDDAALYSGSYTGAPSLANPGFEDPAHRGNWRGSSWYAVPELAGGNVGAERKDWAYRTGTRGIALISYTNETAPVGDYSMTVYQNVIPGTGTYTFSVWMRQEDNAVVTNAEMRIGWYDSTWTNQVQAATVTNIVTPLSSTWTRYELTGTCADTNLHEVRVQLAYGWTITAADVPLKTTMIDDARLNTGVGYPTNFITSDWAYHNRDPQNVQTEQVPGGFGSFVQVNYVTTTTTFYVLADYPTFAVQPDEEGRVGLRTAWWGPVTGGWNEVWRDMTYVTTVTVSAGSPFHGLPAVGSKTLGLWKHDFQQPIDNVTGLPFTNQVTVYYSTYLRTLYGPAETAAIMLLTNGTPNNYTTEPQLFGTSYGGNDNLYVNLRPGVGGDDTDADGMSDAWELLLFGTLTNEAAGDNDVDGNPNIDEYIADTNPTNILSSYSNAVESTSGRAVMIILAGPPTTNTRRYEVYWKTNLMEAGNWTPYGLNVPGNADGSAVSLTVTNDPAKRFYRSGVKLP